jgi:hypothetical protein
MKNVMKNKNLLTALTGIFIVSVLFVGVYSVMPANFVHAQEVGDGGDAPCDCGGDIAPSFIDETASSADSNIAPSFIDQSAPNTEPSIAPTYVDQATPSYSSGYSTSGYLASSFVGSGYLTGSSFVGPSFIPSIPVAPSNSNTNVNTNTNVVDNGNSCTAVNSCNTNNNTSINAPTTVTTVTNPAPVQPIVYNNPPVVYNNPPVVYNNPTLYSPPPAYPRPIAYNNTPYVSLSAVPYTGLDLGFWGTIAYWSFLVLWCLAAAYLIVVKRVQNRIFRSMKNFLFGSSTNQTYRSPSVEDSRGVQPASSNFSQADLAALASMLRSTIVPQQEVAYAEPVATATSESEVDGIDPFVMSQINRVQRA